MLWNDDRGIRKPLTIAGPDKDYGVDAGFGHGVELGRPLPFAPVLGGDIVRDLIQESARDALVSDAPLLLTEVPFPYGADRQSFMSKGRTGQSYG